jgi:intraflagellar transport protein 81
MKGSTFRSRKSELNEIRIERGLMARTQDLLQEKGNHVNEILTLLEEEKGITGYFAMQEDKRNSPGSTKGSEARTDSMEDLTLVIKKLNEEISAKKAAMAPVIKDLRPMRQKAYDVETECEKKKSVYDATAAGLESNLKDLEQEVNRMRDECESLESRESRGKCDREVLSG